MSDDNLSPKQTAIALVVLGTALAAAIYWMSTKRLGPAPAEPPFKSEAERAIEAKLAVQVAQHTADGAQVRARLARAPNARRVSEIVGVLGPVTCAYTASRRDSNPHFYVTFRDAPSVKAPVPAACTATIGWGEAKWDEPFSCEPHAPITTCDVRAALLDASN